MLYTVRPLEKIYAIPTSNDRSKNNKSKDEAEMEYREVPLPNGRIVTRREGENYIVERLNSTDMKDYLKNDYVPGTSLKEKK